MKPTKKTTFIKIEYWDCSNENHRHKTEDVAKRCIHRNANRKPLAHRKVNYERNINAARKAVNGETFKSVGESIGISSGRTRDVVRRVLRHSAHLLQEPGKPPCSFHDIREVRKHKNYWLEQIDKIADHLGVFRG